MCSPLDSRISRGNAMRLRIGVEVPEEEHRELLARTLSQRSARVS